MRIESTFLTAAILTIGSFAPSNAFAAEAPATATPASSIPPDVEVLGAETPPGERAGRLGFKIRLLAGPTYRLIYSVPVTAADIQFGLGWEWKGAAAYFTFNGILGATSFGLFTQHYAPGFAVEGVWDRFHAGVGGQLSVTRINRETNGDAMAGLGIGLHLLAAYDVADFEGGTFLVGLRLSADKIGGTGGANGPIMWGPTGYVGVRF